MPIPFSRADDPEARDGPEADARRQRLRALGLVLPFKAYGNGSVTIDQQEYQPFRARHGEDFWRDVDILVGGLVTDHGADFTQVRTDLRTEVDLARRAANPERYEAREARAAARAEARRAAAAEREAAEVEAWKKARRAQRKARRQRAKVQRLRRESVDLRARVARAAAKVSA